MKKLKIRLILLSLFSCLVSSCITVPRIQKKDAKNNQFSQSLQTWFYVAHPQKIDTTTKIKSDTTYDTTWSNNGQWAISRFLDSLKHISTLGETGIEWLGRQKTNIGEIGIILSSDDTWSGLSTQYLKSDGVWSVQHDIKYITKTIHDSVFTIKVDQTQVNALKTQLQTSRDSINNYMIRYANERSRAANRLTILIILGAMLVLSGFFNFKTLFKL